MLFRFFFKTFALLLFILCVNILFERAQVDIRTLVKTNPLTHTKELIEKEQYAKAHEYLSYFMHFDYVKNNPKAVALFDTIEKKRESFSYKTQKIWQGLIEGKSDENIGNTSAILSDLFLLGDLRDLTIQGFNYTKNEEVDEVIVTLSSLGVIASAASMASAGTTTSVAFTLSTLKLAKRTKKIPNWIARYIKSTFGIMKRTKSLQPISTISSDIFKINQKVGLKQTLNLLNKTRNFKALPKAVKVSAKYGKNSSVLLDIAGKNSIRLIHTLKNIPNKNVLIASQYGIKGLKALSKFGVKRFMLRIGKTGYKGNLDSIYDGLAKQIPTYVLIIISLFIGLLFFKPKNNRD